MCKCVCVRALILLSRACVFELVWMKCSLYVSVTALGVATLRLCLMHIFHSLSRTLRVPYPNKPFPWLASGGINVLQ